MDKVDRHIILKITNKGVFYNDNAFIEWKYTNFPSKKEFNFNDRTDIFWEAKLLSFDAKKSLLKVDIVNYNVSQKKKSFVDQKAKFPFQKIWFNRLKWVELQKIMNIYRQISFDKITDSGEQVGERKGGNKTLMDFSDRTQKNTRIAINFKYPLMKTKFKMGYVEIEKKLKGVSEKQKINLVNTNILPEFDHVKPFFAKALGKRKIEITGFLEIDEKGQIEIKCQSKEINQINEDLITTVKRLKLEDSIFKPKKISVDKSLFTPEEYFEGLEEEQLGNTIHKSEKDILKDVLQLEGIRNRKQLIYLSGKLQSKRKGLRFTLSPKFGFLFYVEGEEMDHFIWELLNSHATYIWSVDRGVTSIDDKLKLIEREVNFIRENGRRIYLNSDKSKDLIFNKINHENSETGVIDGFPKWKMRVNEKIV
ncbi:MAG: hypothetical protein J5I54_08665 [Bacteroidales bacterium]|nr:hypothetical protein [Bacteroidales bacterium]